MSGIRKDNDGTIKFTDDESDMLQAAHDIKQTFIECPCQKIAYDALTSDILSCDFVWTSQVDTERVQKKLQVDDPEHVMWTDFSRSIVMEICLYGFAVYRLVIAERGHDLETREITHKSVAKRRRRNTRLRRLPEVANGQRIVLRWSDKHKEWVPYSDAGIVYDRKDGWRMIMAEKPLKWGQDNIPIYSSSAAKTIELSKMYTSTRRNAEARDEINSEIGVYATMLKNLTTPGTGMSTKPWFQPAVHGAMSAAPGDMHQPFEMKVADRLEAAMGLAAATDKFRKFRETDPIRGDATDHLDVPKEADQLHKEHVITDGFESKEVSFRRAPEDFIRIMDLLFNLILFTYGVMPQVIGKNINSERNAASSRISEVSIDRYNENVRQLRRYVQMAIRDVSTEAVKDSNTMVMMIPCVTVHTLRSVESILYTEAAKKMYSCVYDVPIDFIDDERIKQKQDLMVETPIAKGTRNKPDMTEDQKQASMKAKTERV